ncbi:hypothetical protein QCA50_013771 [Cerrena zonata]|uniref:FAD/NAD(P)-binding domain-containing protein n=1 Tax=Cerrena zonata TaxID=2478898 RepID=A0AAW0FPX5_9APHY
MAPYDKIPQDAATRVVVVGAGIAGICTGIALRKQLGHDNFTIYEVGEEVGGTWRANSYPGCASDVHTHWYSLSTELNPYWTTTHVSQPVLKEYWKDLAKKYRLYDNLVFNAKVASAEWDPRSEVYRIEVHFTDGTRNVEYARVLVAGTGLLNTPNYPSELNGVKNFKGDWFHSANWNHNVDLRNKRVAVIGNGCSAAQFVPIISEDPTTHVTQFWRTPMWYLPKIRGDYPAWQQWTFAHVPLVMKLYRMFLWIRQESLYVMILNGGPKSKARENFMQELTDYMKKTAPEKYHEVLSPKYQFGCKRLIVDTGYYECLHRPNMELSKDPILEINESGILTKNDGQQQFDAIVLATGFHPNDLTFHVRGNDGRTMHQYYAEKGGPTAYYGTMTAGFPNLFIMSGPNTATGHGSVIFTEEVQVNYIMQVIKPILKGLATSFEPTDTASDIYNERIQSKLASSVWSGCSSWYRTNGGKGKITGLFPGTFAEFWWTLRTPVWGDFTVKSGSRWQRRRTLSKVVNTVLGLGLVGAGWYAVQNPEIVQDYASVAKDQATQLWAEVSSQLKL